MPLSRVRIKSPGFKVSTGRAPCAVKIIVPAVKHGTGGSEYSVEFVT
jgi:hypothetical protein